MCALDTTARVARAHILEAMGSAAVGAFDDGTCYRRKEIERAGYEVQSSRYIDCRVAKLSKVEKEQLEAATSNESQPQGDAA